MRHLLQRHQRRIRQIFIATGAVTAVLGAAQLVYPANRALPFVEAGGQAVGGRNTAAIQRQLAEGYENAFLQVKAGTKQFERPLQQLGIEVDAAAAAHKAADYPFWQRLIPFSSVAIMVTRDTVLTADFDDDKVQAFARQVETQAKTEAVNAALKVERGKARVVASTPQEEYPIGRTAAAIQSAAIKPKTVVLVAPQTTPAVFTDVEAETMRSKVQALLDDKLTFEIADKQTRIDAETTGTWLVFKVDKTGSQLDITLKKEKVEPYLKSIQGEAYKAPGTTRVQLIDGREVSRNVGGSGRGVDITQAVTAITGAIRDTGDNTVRLAVTDLPPVIAYDKSYSNTDKGLAGLLAGIVSAKGSYGISLMELGGRSAHAGGNQQFVAASTYKLYVAYAVLKEVEAGRMSWQGSINGTTVAQCFDAMIVVSDNSCAIAFGRTIGWAAITNTVHSVGVSTSTQLGSTMYTTPNDLAYFLYRVQNGSIVSGADRNRLLNAMKRQSYTRAGIPAGVQGMVADKVGIVDGYVHDAAIVYGAKTYILVVMSYGGSWAGIADTARQVDTYVTQ